MVQNRLLDPVSYQPQEIHVRTTDVNRTIESAMANLMGMYPLGRSIESNQSEAAISTLMMSPEDIAEAINEMQRAALPHDKQAVPVYVQNRDNDRFHSYYSCPINN
jgi:hypothetical protein